MNRECSDAAVERILELTHRGGLTRHARTVEKVRKCKTLGRWCGERWCGDENFELVLGVHAIAYDARCGVRARARYNRYSLIVFTFAVILQVKCTRIKVASVYAITFFLLALDRFGEARRNFHRKLMRLTAERQKHLVLIVNIREECDLVLARAQLKLLPIKAQL